MLKRLIGILDVCRARHRHERGSAGGFKIPVVTLIVGWMWFSISVPLFGQGSQQVPVLRPKPPLSGPAAPSVGASTASGNTVESTADDSPVPGDWAPALLDAILSSSNPSAGESLFDATFAAGPDLIPQLQAALKDDRTAEFAAQCLAFTGSARAMDILKGLVADPRDLDLRRFYLGALGEYRDPAITELLLNAVAKSDQEPDRTVTEAAIWALTVRSDPGLASKLRQAESKILDVVIRDDVDNAADVVEARGRYLASPEGKQAGASIENAVRAYFIAALGSEPESGHPAGAASAQARTDVRGLTFNPDGARALAHVVFEDSSGSANYDMVLGKQFGDWNVVSVWGGAQAEAPEIAAPARKPAAPATKKPASSRQSLRSGQPSTPPSSRPGP